MLLAVVSMACNCSLTAIATPSSSLNEMTSFTNFTKFFFNESNRKSSSTAYKGKIVFVVPYSSVPLSKKTLLLLSFFFIRGLKSRGLIVPNGNNLLIFSMIALGITFEKVSA